MEQGATDTIVEILVGILFLTPLRAMFKRVLKDMSDRKESETGFLQYHFPTLYRWWHSKN